MRMLFGVTIMLTTEVNKVPLNISRTNFKYNSWNQNAKSASEIWSLYEGQVILALLDSLPMDAYAVSNRFSYLRDTFKNDNNLKHLTEYTPNIEGSSYIDFQEQYSFMGALSIIKIRSEKDLEWLMTCTSGDEEMNFFSSLFKIDFIQSLFKFHASEVQKKDESLENSLLFFLKKNDIHDGLILLDTYADDENSEAFLKIDISPA